MTRASSIFGKAVLDAPVLLIELLPPSNRSKTWSNVRAYTSIPSLQEILVLHADKVFAESLRRPPEGLWPEEPSRSQKGLELTSIGFELPLAELYEGTGLII